MGAAPHDFPASVLAGLKATPFVRVALCCGRELEGAVEALHHCAFASDMAPLLLDLVDVAERGDFFRRLSASLGGKGCADDLDDLLAETLGWYQPRMVVMIRISARGTLSSIIDDARRVAELTRDCKAPIRFVWLHSAPDAAMEIRMPSWVWPPQWRDIPQIDFSGNPDTVLNRAFSLYLDRRIYWEGAGQQDCLVYLEQRVRSRGLSPVSRSVDEALDHAFDSATIADADRRFIAKCLGESAHLESWLAALRQQLVPEVVHQAIGLWTAAGVVWRPPGMSRMRVTPLAMRVLVNDPGHPLCSALGTSALKSCLAKARANAQLAQMALVLSTQVEAEILDALRGVTDWRSLVAQTGLLDDLTRLQARAEDNQSMRFGSAGCLLDYASFGQLVRVAQQAGTAFRFPLSRERLWQIANVRNLAAHGHAVRWDAIKLLVESLLALGI